MNARQILFIISLFSGMAGSVYAYQPFPCDANFIVQAGVFGSWQGKSQNINIDGGVSDHFKVEHPYDDNVVLGFGYFLKGLDYNQYRILYGLNAFYLANTKVKGKIIQEDQFANLSYQYRLTHFPIYVDVKLISSIWKKADLTVDLGVGPNFIRANHFSETSLDDGMTIPDDIFSGQNSATFSATAGLGIRFNHLLISVPLELSYRFFYLGQSKFHPRSDQVLNSLNTGNNYANALILSVYF